MGADMETQIIIACLKAKVIALRAEYTVKHQYDMNRDFQLTCSVINQTIMNIEAEIIKLEKENG